MTLSDGEGRDEAHEAIGHVLSQGTIVDFLRTLPTPVIAWPGKTLFRVRLHASGLSLPIAESTPAIGYYATWFVAARSDREAADHAREKMSEYWATFHPRDPAATNVSVEEVEAVADWFRWHSRTGLAFYSAEDR